MNRREFFRLSAGACAMAAGVKALPVAAATPVVTQLYAYPAPPMVMTLCHSLCWCDYKLASVTRGDRCKCDLPAVGDADWRPTSDGSYITYNMRILETCDV